MRIAESAESEEAENNDVTGRGVILPVGAVVNPTHLLARLQQVKNPCGAATLFLDLQVATFDLRLSLSVYVQGLLV